MHEIHQHEMIGRTSAGIPAFTPWPETAPAGRYAKRNFPRAHPGGQTTGAGPVMTGSGTSSSPEPEISYGAFRKQEMYGRIFRSRET